VSQPDPGRVLRRSLVAWGWGHLLLGRRGVGVALVVAEIVAILLVAWLTIGLATSSAYLVPFLAGVAFIVAWAWQAFAAYGAARTPPSADSPTSERSAATAAGWLSLPLLVWGAGFWLVGAHAATPAAALDDFVSAWTAGELDDGDWPPSVLAAAAEADAALGIGPDKYQDVRFSIVAVSRASAEAVGETVDYEREPVSLLGIFPGTELVPVPDEQLMTMELVARPVELPGGGDIGAVRWELVAATSP
jgi:hypothetical protein